MPETFTSSDGSTRCRGCHLHPDTCTCNLEHPIWPVLAAAFHVDHPDNVARALAKKEPSDGL